jgi:Protein of unknown function (DUF3341)
MTRIPLYGALARFDGPAELLAAVRRLHDHGYRRLDAYSPFPIHGMGAALGLGRSKVPAVALAGGVFGAVCAQTLQWYQSTIAYPLITGGKPLNSAEAFVPITFETTMLFAAFGAVIGMLALNGLPRLYHPVFRGKSFARASNDGFFLSVEARDPQFEVHQTKALLESLGGIEIEFIES